MNTISPVNVSIYDFLFEDTQPLIPLLADTAHLSLAQTQIAVTSGLQAILTALLAYHQRHSASALHKNLLTYSTVKKLRQYNAMNFATMSAIAYQQNDSAARLFEDSDRLKQAYTYIAKQLDTDPAKIQTLMNTLTLIALRELAILVEYSQLDKEEIDKWFILQPQFLSNKRFESNANSNTLPAFDPFWYKLIGFKPSHNSQTQDLQQATPNYLKAIGRSDVSHQQGHDDTLIFAQMPSVVLPHQRWLLQLAKISEIYLSRKRLRINSEPVSAPTKPLVSFSMLTGNDEATPTTASETAIKYDKPKPLYKNPALLLTILVIAVLGASALLKYQLTQANIKDPNIQTIIESSPDQSETYEQQDVAIVRVDEIE